MTFRFKASVKVAGKEFTFEKGDVTATTEIVKLAGTILTCGVELGVWINI